MKRQIRRMVFETNSSSTHSLTMCTREEYRKWENGEVYFDRDNDRFITLEEIISEFKEARHWKTNELLYPNVDWNDLDKAKEVIFDEDNRFVTEEEYFDDEYLEGFYDSYTTKTGEEIVAFGKYGYDG